MSTDALLALANRMDGAASHAQRHGGNLSWKYVRQFATDIRTLATQPVATSVVTEAKVRRWHDIAVNGELSDWTMEQADLRAYFAALSHTHPPADVTDEEDVIYVGFDKRSMEQRMFHMRDTAERHCIGEINEYVKRAALSHPGAHP